MNNIDPNENEEDDEFECSECDFKCSSESDMINHSTIHQCPNNTSEDPLNIIPVSTTTDNVNLQAEYKNKNDSESNTKLTFASTKDLKHYGSPIKRKLKFCDETAIGEIHHSNKFDNEVITLSNRLGLQLVHDLVDEVTNAL